VRRRTLAVPTTPWGHGKPGWGPPGGPTAHIANLPTWRGDPLSGRASTTLSDLMARPSDRWTPQPPNGLQAQPNLT